MADAPNNAEILHWWREIGGTLYPPPYAAIRAAVDKWATTSPTVAAPPAAPVPWPKAEDITEEMRARFERLYVVSRGELNRKPDGTYRALRTEADWVFYQRAWADALESQSQPQPAQPLTGATPLSDEQIKTVLNEALGGEAVRVPPGWRAVIAAVERAHGITAPSTPTPPEVAP